MNHTLAHSFSPDCTNAGLFLWRTATAALPSTSIVSALRPVSSRHSAAFLRRSLGVGCAQLPALILSLYQLTIQPLARE